MAAGNSPRLRRGELILRRVAFNNGAGVRRAILRFSLNAGSFFCSRSNRKIARLTRRLDNPVKVDRDYASIDGRLHVSPVKRA